MTRIVMYHVVEFDVLIWLNDGRRHVKVDTGQQCWNPESVGERFGKSKTGKTLSLRLGGSLSRSVPFKQGPGDRRGHLPSWVSEVPGL